jgi:hypothetical protein
MVRAQGRRAAFGKRVQSPPGPANNTGRLVLRAPYDAIRVYLLGGGLPYCCDLMQAATCGSQVPVKCPEYPVLSGFYGREGGLSRLNPAEPGAN